mmetsp:Transcript_37872/g.67530  ORF Transcript_37872/g.67530 Transcript_37872/m.67530 type:complete len:120 (+) Transcript_37872:88-447(+)
MGTAASPQYTYTIHPCTYTIHPCTTWPNTTITTIQTHTTTARSNTDRSPMAGFTGIRTRTAMLQPGPLHTMRSTSRTCTHRITTTITMSSITGTIAITMCPGIPEQRAWSSSPARQCLL